MSKYQNLIIKFSWCLLPALLVFVSCEKERLTTAPETTEQTAVQFRSSPPFLYAVTEYAPGFPSMIYEIERATQLPTGYRTNVFYNGIVVEDIIGICRMADINFNNGKPFYAVTLGPNSGVPQNPSVVFGIPDIKNGEIMFECNDNDTDIANGDYVKDIEWSDWGGLGLIGIENTPRANGFHYLINFKQAHQLEEWQIINVPATEEVRGLSWVDYGHSNSFNCQGTSTYPLHHFDAFDVSHGGTVPGPYPSFITLYMTTLDAGGVAKLYSLVFSGTSTTIEAYHVQTLSPGAGVQVPQSEVALGWDHAGSQMYAAGDPTDEYNYDALNICPNDAWDLTKTSGFHNWNASIADFTSQPFNF